MLNRVDVGGVRTSCLIILRESVQFKVEMMYGNLHYYS